MRPAHSQDRAVQYQRDDRYRPRSIPILQNPGPPTSRPTAPPALPIPTRLSAPAHPAPATGPRTAGIFKSFSHFFLPLFSHPSFSRLLPPNHRGSAQRRSSRGRSTGQTLPTLGSSAAVPERRGTQGRLPVFPSPSPACEPGTERRKTVTFFFLVIF